MSTSASAADSGASRSSLTLLSRADASSAASTGGGSCPSRNASAVRIRAGAGRRSRWTISSSDASSAQWTSSRTRTTGWRAASPTSSARTARCARKRSSCSPPSATSRRRGGGRQHARELGGPVPDERLDAVGAQRRDVVVERGHPDAEGQVALELRAAPDQHEVLARLRAGAQLRQQPRLAGARLAVDDQPACAGGSQPVERSVKARQLLATTHEEPGSGVLRLGHGLSLTPWARGALVVQVRRRWRLSFSAFSWRSAIARITANAIRPVTRAGKTTPQMTRLTIVVVSALLSAKMSTAESTPGIIKRNGASAGSRRVRAATALRAAPEPVDAVGDLVVDRAARCGPMPTRRSTPRRS